MLDAAIASTFVFMLIAPCAAALLTELRGSRSEQNPDDLPAKAGTALMLLPEFEPLPEATLLPAPPELARLALEAPASVALEAPVPAAAPAIRTLVPPALQTIFPSKPYRTPATIEASLPGSLRNLAHTPRTNTYLQKRAERAHAEALLAQANASKAVAEALLAVARAAAAKADAAAELASLAARDMAEASRAARSMRRTHTRPAYPQISGPRAPLPESHPSLDFPRARTRHAA